MNKKLLFCMILMVGIALMSISVLAVKGVNITDSEIILSGTGGAKTGYVHVTNIGTETVNITFESSILVDSSGHSLTLTGLSKLYNIVAGQSPSASFTVDLDNYAGNYTGVITARVEGSSESDSVMTYVNIQENGLGLSMTPSVADSTEADTVITQTISVHNYANKDITGTILKSGYSGLTFSLDREGSYVFPAQQTTQIVATIVVPAGAASKAYTGKVNVTSGTNTYSSTLQTIVQPTFKASVPQVKLDLDPGATVTGTMVIYNTGNVDLTGLSLTNIHDFIDDDGDLLNITVTPTTGINVPKGGSATVQVRATASSKMDSGEGLLEMDLVGSGINVDANVLINVRDILQIADIDLSDDTFKPGDTIEIDVEVENIAAKTDIEDVEVKIYFLDGSSKLEDDDGDDIEDTSEKFDLDAGDSKTVSLSFVMPYGVNDGDTFTVHVEAKGKNADDSTEKYTVVDESLDLTAEKEEHQLELFDIRFDSDTLSCSRSTYLRLGVRNIGDSNEDDIELAVTSEELGISKHEIFDLDNDPKDDEFETERSFLLNLQSAPTGTYSIKIAVYYDDDDEKEEETATLTIASCSGSSSGSTSGSTTTSSGSTYVPPSTPTGGSQDVDFTYTGGSTAGIPAVSATTVSPRISSTKTGSSWTDSVAFLVLVGLANVLLVIVIIVAVVTLIKK